MSNLQFILNDEIKSLDIHQILGENLETGIELNVSLKLTIF